MNKFSDPKRIVDQLVPLAGLQVADFGAGNGAYTFALAERVQIGKTGNIYAIDVHKDMLEKIAQEAKQRNLNNIHIVWGDLEQEHGSRLRESSVQMVIVANILFQVSNIEKIVSEAYRILEPEGRIVVIDWSGSFNNIGPRGDHIVSEEKAKDACQAIGFNIDRDINAGEHHYGFIGIKKIETNEEII